MSSTKNPAECVPATAPATAFSAVGTRVHCASEPPKCGRAPVSLADGASSKSECRAASPRLWYPVPGRRGTAALSRHRRPRRASTSGPFRARRRRLSDGPTTSEATPSVNDNHTHPRASPIAAASVAGLSTLLPNQPVIVQGAPDAISSDSSDNGTREPHPAFEETDGVRTEICHPRVSVN